MASTPEASVNPAADNVSPPPAPSNAQAPSSPQDDAVEDKPEDAKKPTTVGDEEHEDGEVSEDEPNAPPLPAGPVPSGGPPLPAEPVPKEQDDGWDCTWDPNTQAWFFSNRFTGKTQWENPRVQTSEVPTGQPGLPVVEKPAAGGYNPAIHGDYDPNAWYAKGDKADEDEYDAEAAAAGAYSTDPYASTATFNRFTGSFQAGDAGPGRHSDEAKSKRQMNAFFDADAAANAHDGRSLKAERTNKRLSKTEVKAFKEKRRAKKEEKRRAWLRD